MSVRYSTRIGYGYIIHADEITSEEFENKLNNEYDEYALPIDSYAGRPNYFFGLLYVKVPHGEGYRIPIHQIFDRDKLCDMIEKYKDLCPNKDNYICHDYILSCVD